MTNDHRCTCGAKRLSTTPPHHLRYGLAFAGYGIKKKYYHHCVQTTRSENTLKMFFYNSALPRLQFGTVAPQASSPLQCLLVFTTSLFIHFQLYISSKVYSVCIALRKYYCDDANMMRNRYVRTRTAARMHSCRRTRRENISLNQFTHMSGIYLTRSLFALRSSEI